MKIRIHEKIVNFPFNCAQFPDISSPMTMDTAVASSQQDGSVDYSLSDEEPSQSESNSPTAVLTQVAPFV